MCQIVLVILTIGWVVLFAFKAIERITHTPNGYDIIDRNQYQLILGENAKQVFMRFKTAKLNGIHIDDPQVDYLDTITGESQGGLPFIFLNITSLQNNYSNHQVHTCIMAETTHMAIEVYSGYGYWETKEDEIVTWAEKEANEIIELLKSKKYIR